MLQIDIAIAIDIDILLFKNNHKPIGIYIYRIVGNSGVMLIQNSFNDS